VDLDSGLTINTWDAETNSDRGLDALAVIPGEAIIIGGAFTQSGGQNLNGLARFNLLSASTLTPPQPELDILLVVADPAALQAGETEIKDRLETQGATVTLADDNTVTVADADSSDAVLVSQGVSSSAVNTKLNNTTTGVVVWKPSLYDDLGLTASAGGTLAAQTQLDIVDPTHPIADGLTGTVTVYDPAKKVTHGTPAATAAVVADTAGAGTEAVIFTYNEGDTLANSTTAAGRRVGFYFDTNAPTVASNDGWVLFDNTVTWTANSPAPISQRSTITLAGVSVATVSEGEVTWLVADNLGSPTVTYRAVGKTPASVALYYPYGSPRTNQIDGTGTGFTGQVSDLQSGTGLAFYNARYYDPALGRFTQPDTIVPNASNGQDFNRYSYVLNNPVNFVDPSGRCVLGLPCPSPGEIREAAEDAVEQGAEAVGAAVEAAGVVGDALIGLATDVGEFVAVDVVVPVVGGIATRGVTITSYGLRSYQNFQADPLQGAYDLVSGTATLSAVHAVYATSTGARISDENCVAEAVCFVGGTSLAEFGGKSIIALGTTIHASDGPLNSRQGLHEGAHVQDFQLFGSFGFLANYLGETVRGVAYEELTLEQRAVSVAETGQRGRDASDYITKYVTDAVRSLWPF